MLNRIKSWMIWLVICTIGELAILLGIFWWKEEWLTYIAITFTFINGLAAIILLSNHQKDLKQRVLSLSQILGKDGQEALEIGRLGMMTYDDDYQITWTSELFDKYQEELISQRLLRLFPSLKDLFNGEADELEVDYHGNIYRVIRKSAAQLLFWHDITEVAKLTREYEDNKLIIGMLHLDNYADTLANEDEQLTALLNTNLRQPIIKWAKEKAMLIRRLRSDRFILVLNEKIYKDIESEYFSLLNDIRERAKENNVDITLSMAFARGSNNLSILDEMANSLIELAQSRGGDQVAMRIYQREVKFFGGSSEAVEKSSKVKARVMARTIRELSEKASKIFIVGHKDIDFDCLGSMLALSKMAQIHNDEVYVISEGVSYENQLKKALFKFKESIIDKHNFISETQALEKVDESALIIAVDHHNPGLCSAPDLLVAVTKLIVIDHHRRGENFFTLPTLVYLETSASSSSELVIELLEYQPKEVILEPFESTLMLTGIIVDTNHFRLRSGKRTFEAAGVIKAKGANSAEAENFLKEDFDDFDNKNKIYSYSKIIDDNIIIAAVETPRTFSRSLISQAADELLTINNIEAVFVIAKSDNGMAVISARSKGKINVQVILEQMHGGGHFGAAGLQRENSSVAELKKELLTILKGDKNESNLIN